MHRFLPDLFFVLQFLTQLLLRSLDRPKTIGAGVVGRGVGSKVVSSKVGSSVGSNMVGSSVSSASTEVATNINMTMDAIRVLAFILVEGGVCLLCIAAIVDRKNEDIAMVLSNLKPCFIGVLILCRMV